MTLPTRTTTNTDDSGAFLATMERMGWAPILTLYGELVSWRHTRTGRTVSNDAALRLWRRDGLTPVPF